MSLYRVLLAFGMLILVTAMPTTAQLSPEVRDLKRAADQYDQRGYMNGSSITVDGKLIVSNTNGNVSYRYPLGDYQSAGYPISISLNYSSSVSSTCFGKFLMPFDMATDRYDIGVPISTYGGWSQFSQNRPVWLVGVNGFAVQALSQTSTFHIPYSTLNPVSGSKWKDTNFVWTIEGYDFCNRMAHFGAVGVDPSQRRDEIKLLREDGSVLTLINVRTVFDTLGPLTQTDSSFYTGMYFENSANAKGFAKVELADEYRPGFAKNWGGGSDAMYQARRVHYYPGDGLEYVFREWTIPYGMKVYMNNDPNWTNQLFGGISGGPTIFYLQRFRFACSIKNDIFTT